MLILEIGAVDNFGNIFLRQCNPCETNNIIMDLQNQGQSWTEQSVFGPSYYAPI